MPAELVVLASRNAGRSPNASAANHIRDLIRSGTLALGARISDKAVAAELGVSRTPVREALVQLQSEGLVTIRPQSGTFVIDVDADDVRRICAARTVLETGSLKLAAASVSSDTLARLGLLVGQASIALHDGDLERCDELDSEFHEALVAMCANDYLIKAYSGISDRLRALRRRMPRGRERMARAIAQHRRIVDLWAAGRVEEAANELTAHVSNVERLLTALNRAETAS